MSRRRQALSAAAMAAATLLVAATGCTGEDDASVAVPETRFAAALATLGAGGGIGVGWVEPSLVGPGAERSELIGDAVGPNASSVVDAAPALERRFGFDPLDSERLVSLGGSYAFGLRIDGVDAGELGRAIAGDGSSSTAADGVESIDADSYASVPEPLQAAGVQGLGAADAVAEDFAVLAISDRARSALLGEGEPLADEPLYAAAAACLGDVVAAKLTPDSNVVSTDLGVSLVAAGVRADGTEVLCTLGGDDERAQDIESNLRRLLRPGGRDPITGAALSRSITGVGVGRGAPYGVNAVRAEIELTRAEMPGYAFDLVSSAAVVGLLNGEGRTFAAFGVERDSAGARG